MKLAIAAALLGAASATTPFANVTHVANENLAIGVTTTTMSDMYSSGPGVIISQDGGETLTVNTDANVAAKLGLLMGIAASGDTVLVGGIGGSLAYSNDAGQTWAASPGIKFSITQDVKYEAASGNFAACGIFNGVGGLAYGEDPSSLTIAKIDVAFLDGSNTPRYCSMPSSNVMYATAGMWSDDSTEADTRHITRRMSLGKDGLTLKPFAKPVGDITPGQAWGQVAKSVDGGQTWTVIFTDETSGMYPNDISCSDENTCAFVMDGSDTPNESQIISTTDGGATWTIFDVPTGAGNSLMTIRMTGPTEAWAAGGDTTGRIWHSTDLVNWDDSAFATKDAGYVTGIAIGPDGTAGYITGALKSGICSVITFNY